MDMRILFVFVVSVLLSGLALGGCESESSSDANALNPADTDTLVVTNAWARPAPEGGVTALYFELHNSHSTADTLTRVSTPISDRTEIHTTVQNDDGTMGMRELANGLPVPADTVTTLRAGGPHVMIYDVNTPLTMGNEVNVTLHLNANSHAVSAQVRPSPPQ